MRVNLVLLILFSCASAEIENDLFDHLSKDSSPYIRPVVDTRSAVNVTFGFSLRQIINLHEQEQFVTMKIWMRMVWKNEFTVWEPSEWGNMTTIRVQPTDVWLPDIFLEDDVGDEVSQGPHLYKTQVILNSDGTSSWYIPVKLQSSCRVDVGQFPFDHQVCKLVFLSWTHNANELDMTFEESKIVGDHYIKSSEWILLAVEKERIELQYDCCPEPFVNLEYRFYLHRRPFYHVHFLVLPCIIQMLLILSSFFLPLESGERIGVVITILLVFAVYLQVLSESLPETSSSTPLLSRFFILTMAESAFLLIVTFFLLNVHFKGSSGDAQPVPGWVKIVFFKYFGKIVFVKYKAKDLYDDDDDDDDDFCKRNNRMANGGYEDQKNLLSKQPIPSSGGNALIQEIGVITQSIRDMKKSEVIEEEWRLLAKVLNRLCFLMFLIIYSLSTLIILVPPLINHDDTLFQLHGEGEGHQD